MMEEVTGLGAVASPSTRDWPGMAGGAFLLVRMVAACQAGREVMGHHGGRMRGGRKFKMRRGERKLRSKAP